MKEILVIVAGMSLSLVITDFVFPSIKMVYQLYKEDAEDRDKLRTLCEDVKTHQLSLKHKNFK